jgi:hypothetical protein
MDAPREAWSPPPSTTVDSASAAAARRSSDCAVVRQLFVRLLTIDTKQPASARHDWSVRIPTNTEVDMNVKKLLLASVIAAACPLVTVSPAAAASPSAGRSVSVAADTTPPSVPQNLRTCGVVGNQDVLCWDASTDDSGVINHYWVIVDGHQRARPRATTYEINTLVLLGRITTGPHTITVQAVDPSLNRSAPSDPLQIVVN